MFTNTLITFRETLEAGLVIGIVLSILKTMNQKQAFKIVYHGLVAGIATSIMGAYLFHSLSGGFQGNQEKAFEGVVMLVSALLITTLIIWVAHQKNMTESLKTSVSVALSKTHRWGLFFIIYTAIVREGIETILFLHASHYVETGSHLFWFSCLGVLLGVSVCIFLFKGLSSIPLQKIFQVTNVLLILFAGGLLAHGIHELQSAHILPTIVKEIWNLNPILTETGHYPILHEKGIIGSFLKGFLGYNGNPSFLEVNAYILYMTSIFIFLRTRKRAPKETT